MKRPRRRLVLGLLCGVAITLVVVTLRISWEWKRALDDVSVMIVPTVVLPTSTPLPQPIASTSVAIQPTPEPTHVPEPGGPINVLLLGTDARPGADISRTDAVVVCRIDPQLNRVSILSLPRDLLVAVPGYGKRTINAAYPIGEKQISRGAGGALARQTVSDLLDIPIDHYMLINFEGFKTLIDKLDGVWIDVPKEIDDPKYPVGEYDGDNRTMKVHFDAGLQKMDGQNALIYSRTRHADSDFGRIQRQQEVMLAVFNRIRERGLLSQITSVDDYTSSLRDYIRTDMTRNDMLSLASIGPRLQADNIQRFTIDSHMVKARANPYALILVDSKGLKRLVDQMTDGSAAAAGEELPSP